MFLKNIFPKNLIFIASGIIIFSITDNQIFAQPTSYLPINHRVYDFIERMEHNYFIKNSLSGTKPFTRLEAARLLYGMLNAENILSKADREEYVRLLDEFKADFQGRSGLVWEDKGPVDKLPGFLNGFIYRNRHNLYSTRGSEYSLYFDPVITRKYTFGKLHNSQDDDNVFIAGNGFDIRGDIGDKVGFLVRVTDSKEWGSRNYPANTSTTLPGIGFASFKGDRAEFDETNSHIALNLNPFIFSFGRGENLWGWGKSGTLLLSGYSSPYDMFKIETNLGNFKYTFFTSQLRQYPPIAKFYYNVPVGVTQDSVEVKKYMSANRLEMNIGRRFNIGLYEAVVFGGRSELAYLNPLMFLRGAEHSGGDHDNAFMGLDFRLFLHRFHSVYGEFLIDDITTTKLGTDWYGNKLAYQIGSYMVSPLGFDDSDIRIEYTRINPWVYTHRFPVNTFTHFGDVLGYQAGPNSDEVFLELRKRFSGRFHSGISFMQIRHGKNPPGVNLGGDPLDVFKQGDSEKAKFLQGVLEKTSVFSVDCSYELFWQCFLHAGYSYETMNEDGINIYRISFGLNE